MIKKKIKKKIEIVVRNSTHAKPSKMKMEDVWGRYNKKRGEVVGGMIVANSEQRCPIFKDKVPYKSVTVVCKTDQEGEVSFWLEYVHGGGSISNVKKLKDGKIAIRSDYQCW